MKPSLNQNFRACQKLTLGTVSVRVEVTGGVLEGMVTQVYRVMANVFLQTWLHNASSTLLINFPSLHWSIG